jgi:hypothetical protein
MPEALLPPQAREFTEGPLFNHHGLQSGLRFRRKDASISKQTRFGLETSRGSQSSVPQILSVFPVLGAFQNKHIVTLLE